MSPKRPALLAVCAIVCCLIASGCSSSEDKAAAEVAEANAANTEVEWLASEEVQFAHRTQAMWPKWRLVVDGSSVTVVLKGTCGDECGFTTTLELQDTDDLPEILSYRSTSHDSGSPEPQRMEEIVEDGRLEISAWEPENGLVAGRLLDGANTEFVFYVDLNDTSLTAKLSRGEEITTDDLSRVIADNDTLGVFQTLLEALNNDRSDSITTRLLEEMLNDPSSDLSFSRANDLFEEAFASNDSELVEAALGLGFRYPFDGMLCEHRESILPLFDEGLDVSESFADYTERELSDC